MKPHHHKNFDVLIIGAGVSGCAVARELSRYRLRVCVLEKEEDVGCGASKANSAVVHAGFDAKSGSLMARLNVEGNAMMDELARKLDIPFTRNGSLVLCLDEHDLPELQTLYERGIANGVPGLQLLTEQEVREMEPNVSQHTVAALHAPSGGIICPFELTIAMAENAHANGVEFRLNEEVTSLAMKDGLWHVRTAAENYVAKYVVNAAGVYADVFHNMVCGKELRITPRKGEYMLFDRSAGDFVTRTIFRLPGKLGKGVLVAPTVHGNLLVGPTASDIDDKEGTNTTAEGLDAIRQKAAEMVQNLPWHQVITSFSGLRAHEAGHEFVIGEVKDAPGFIDCAGIESPGLTSSPAVGKMVAAIIFAKENPAENPDFIPTRKKEHTPRGRIVCRCEMVTEGEIVDAIHRPLGAKTLDGVKRRTRAGMGRCQSGFCCVRVMEIIAKERGVAMAEVTKCGGESRILAGET